MAILILPQIESTPDILGGKPRIAGRRISVANIAVLHVRHNWSVRRIARELDLDLAQVHAALAYYYAHQAEIDRSIDADDVHVEQVGTSLLDILQRAGYDDALHAQ